MSVTLTLVPLAVAVSMSLTTASAALLARHRSSNALPVLETAFVDAELLQKTLSEHGLQVQAFGENELIVRSESGTLRYYRAESGVPFLLELSHVTNMPELLDDIDELQNEYGRNVQSFTYGKVMQSLIEHGMTVDEEEVLEDNSILLTLNLNR